MHMVVLSTCMSARSPTKCGIFFSLVSQSNVTVPEENCPLSPDAMWNGVFPHSEEVEERNYYQVRDRFQMRGHPVIFG
jgi:hypothetical protein